MLRKMATRRLDLFRSLFIRGLKYNLAMGRCKNKNFLKLFLKIDRKINYPRLVNLLQQISEDEVSNLIKFVFFLRNPRKGRGLRLIGRYIYQWLLINFPVYFEKVIHRIPDEGRWDDLFWLFPGALKLDNPEFIKKNYISKIKNKESFVRIRKVQRSVVSFVSSKLLENFKKFMEGDRGFELFAKWMPSETGSLNKKFKLVETICDELNISLKDYRVIYLTPLRRASNICEKYMCDSDWNHINYNTIGKCSLRRYSKAFQRHDSVRFEAWKQAHQKLYFIKPQNIINTYLNKILNFGWRNKDLTLENEWQRTLGLLKEYGNSNSIALIDTRGTMYKSRQGVSYISIAIALGLVYAESNDEYKNRGLTFRRSKGFTEHELTDSLFDNICQFRLTFTDFPKVADITEWIGMKNFNAIKTVVYITCTSFTISKNYTLNCRLLIWEITAKNIDYYEKGDLAVIKGYSNEIFNYLLIHGDFNPTNSLSIILKCANSK